VRDELQTPGCGEQASIAGPQLAAAGQSDRGKQMGVDVTDAEPVKRYDIDHALDFIVGRRGGGEPRVYFRVAGISPTVARPRTARSAGEPERPTKNRQGTIR
jgi:hypothetical protein